MKNHFNYIESITKKIEDAIQQALQNHEEVVNSIILGWSYDRTKIHIWFESKWESYSYCDSDKSNITLDESCFAETVDKIATDSEFADQINTLAVTNHYQDFGNIITFTDKNKQTAYSKARNLFIETLILVTQNICRRRKISNINDFVCFKVEELINKNHPNLTAIYHELAENELIAIEVESPKENKEFSCYCSCIEENIVFFKNDESESDWKDIWAKEDPIVSLPLSSIERFSIDEKYGDKLITISGAIFGTLTLKIEEDNYHTKHNDILIEKIAAHIRSNRNIIESTKPLLVSPSDENGFPIWMAHINTSDTEFSWTELEGAVKKYGLAFLYRFLPSYSTTHKYYNAVIKTSVSTLIHANEHKMALDYFHTLSDEKQREWWHLKRDCLICLGDFDLAISFLKRIKEDDASEVWIDKLHLPIVESLKQASEGNNEAAVALLESVDEGSKKDSTFQWAALYRQSYSDPTLAYHEALKILSSKSCNYPCQTNFKHCQPIYDLFDISTKALSERLIEDKKITQIKTTTNSKTTSFKWFELIEKELNTETAQQWNIVTQDTHKALGSILTSFQHHHQHYAYFKNGDLTCISSNEQKILVEETESTINLVESSSFVAYYHGLLFIGHNFISIYNVETNNIDATVYRYFSNEIDHIYANEDYMVVCSIDGAEYFEKDELGHYQFVRLLSVGTTDAEYTWAKASIIINNYLHITAGNLGLVTYKLVKGAQPSLVNVLTCDDQEPFCDNIFHYQDYLILDMSGKHWVVDISNNQQPQSHSILCSRKGGKKTGPFIMDGMLSFLDDDKAFIWKYKLNSKTYDATCESVIKDGESMSLPYSSHFITLGEQIIISSSYGLTLLQKSAMPKYDTSQIEKLNAEADSFYEKILQQLVLFFKENETTKLNLFVIDCGSDHYTISGYADTYLTQLIGYSSEALFKFNIEYELDLTTQPFPCDFYFERDLHKTHRNIIKALLMKCSQLDEKHFAQQAHFLYEGYNANTDRNSLILEHSKIASEANS